MAKSKSQRMKEYRQRKKELHGGEWLRRERERVRIYKIPVGAMTREEQEHKRAANRKHCETYRKKQKLNNGEAISTYSPGDNNITSRATTAEDINGVSSTSVDNMREPLTIKMNFNTPGNSRQSRGRKRVSRALSRQYRQNEKLQEENASLKRKLNSARKKLNRIEKQQKHKSPREVLSPNGKADRVLEENGIDPSKAPTVKQKLVFAECLTEEIKEAAEVNGLSIVNPIIFGKKMKQYRLKKKLGQTIGVNRKKINGHNKLVQIRKRRRSEELNHTINRDIKEFLERDDNSRLLPGKQDAVKVGKGRVQKRVLNDYMHNLHEKFLAECKHKVSLSTFYRKKPPAIAHVNFSTRSVCLCQKHQNFALKLRCLKNNKVTAITSPDKFMKTFSTEEAFSAILEGIATDEVKFQEWKRQKMKDGTEKMRVVEIAMPRHDFIQMMKQHYRDFGSHIDRVGKQYLAVKVMKEKLPESQVIVQMDFSENYSCQSLEEVQSAYWNSSMVTLHPAVIYRRRSNNLEHKSVVFVSEVLQHNAAMVTVIADKIIEIAKSYVENLEAIHFITDSPTSQYRNKSIFNYMNSLSLQNIKASWQYFESGHGKGPCDGIGGTTKRNADNAVKKGVIIQDADDFYAWASKSESSIMYVKVNEEEYRESVKKIENENVKPIKGTMKIHSVVSNEKGFVRSRETTCACDDCFNYVSGFRDTTLCMWTKQPIEVKAPKTSSQKKNVQVTKVSLNPEKEVNAVQLGSDTDNSRNENELPTDNSSRMKWKEDDYVLVVYDKQCYVGKVTEIDLDDDEVEVNCMEECNKIQGRYKWPRQVDRIWLNTRNILKVIPRPIPTAKSKRMYTVDTETSLFIEKYNHTVC